jgi:hypothetical protein
VASKQEVETSVIGGSTFLLVLGLLLLGTGAVVLYDQTRGLRNNNPGNIKYNANIQWQGQVGEDSGGFVIFDTMTDGVRALALNLYNYGQDGLNTVQAIITRWSTTDQAAYVANVSAALGVAPTDTLDMTDTTTITNLVNAIITQENGLNPISAATIQTGVSEAVPA